MKEGEYCFSEIQDAAKICKACNRVQNEFLNEIAKVSQTLEYIKNSVFQEEEEAPGASG